MRYSDWPTVLLEDVCNDITVGHVGSMTSEYRESGIPFFRSKNIEPFGIDWNDLRYINSEFHEKLKKSRLTPGDVVIVRTGKPGAATIIPDLIEEANCSDLVIVRPGKRINARYLVYYLNSTARHHIRAHLVGAVQQHFNIGSARKMELPLPPLSTQKSIAHILGTLDDKIELNRKMNHTLESMARAIFKSWFVDFDPVRAKMDGRQPVGMDAETAKLFPDSFEDSELGLVPEGWEVRQVGDFVECVGGGTPSTKVSRYWEGGSHCWATPRDFSKLESSFFLQSDRQITESGLAKISSGLLPENTLLMSSRAPVGYLAISCVPTAINQGFIAMKSNSLAEIHYLLNWCRENMSDIENRASGTTFQEISKKNFRPIPCIVPEARLLEKFSSVVGALYSKIINNLRQSDTLANIRDTLLPKLLSGEISVGEAEKEVEAAV